MKPKTMTPTPPDKDEIDEILDTLFGKPYPDYNHGLLPDEAGYDAIQERRNYEELYAKEQCKQAINRLYIKRSEVLSKVESAFDEACEKCDQESLTATGAIYMNELLEQSLKEGE